MKLLIVIVSYKATDLTIDCLQSLEPEVAQHPEVKVVVCENGTGTEAVAALTDAIERHQWRSWVDLMSIHPNRGFTGGNNAVLRAALASDDPPDLFLLLNADTLMHEGALGAMLAEMDRQSDVGILSCRLQYVDGTLQNNRFRDYRPATEMIRAAGTGIVTRLLRSADTPMGSDPAAGDPEWVCFACAMIRREVFEAVGLLDEGYHLYFDDPDLCRRARMAGWRVAVADDARVTHLIGKSNPDPSAKQNRRRRPRYFYESRARYYAKYFGRRGLWLANGMWCLGRAISLVKELVLRRPSHVCEREWRDIWTNAWQPLHGRHTTQADIETAGKLDPLTP